MENTLDNTLKRMNIKVPAYIQDYYKSMGEKYGMPYSNYMTMILINYYENEKAKQLISEFNGNLTQMKTMTDGTMTSEEMLKQMKSMIDDMKALDK